MKQSMAISGLAGAVRDIKLAILQSRARAAHAANAEALKLYFYVGGYISNKTRTAKWGSGAVEELSNRLQIEMPGLRGFSATSMVYMRLFYEAWTTTFVIRKGKDSIHHLPSDELSVSGESKESIYELAFRHLPSDELGMDDLVSFLSVGFTHHREILTRCKTAEERWYYIHACAKRQWTVIELESHLRANDYRHVGALPNNFGKTIAPVTEATRAVRSFRDEYLLELVNLDNVDAMHDQDVNERVLSKSLVLNIEKTIQALGGSDFCFMGREKRLMVEGEEVFIDLLFFHRGLQAMVAFELKMGKFRPAYLGQLSLYLSALDKLEKKEYEKPTVGILLCEEMNTPFVQLAVQDISKPIGIATYKTIRDIPKPYKALAPVLKGVRQAFVEAKRESEGSKSAKPSRKKKGGKK